MCLFILGNWSDVVWGALLVVCCGLVAVLVVWWRFGVVGCFNGPHIFSLSTEVF